MVAIGTLWHQDEIEYSKSSKTAYTVAQATAEDWNKFQSQVSEIERKIKETACGSSTLASYSNPVENDAHTVSIRNDFEQNFDKDVILTKLYSAMSTLQEQIEHLASQRFKGIEIAQELGISPQKVSYEKGKLKKIREQQHEEWRQYFFCE